MKPLKKILITTLSITMILLSHTTIANAAVSNSLDNEYSIETVITDATIPQNYATLSNTSHTITKTKTTYIRNSNGNILWSVSITATFTYNGSSSSCISCSPNATSSSSDWRIKSVSSSKNGNSATAVATATHSALILSKDYTQSVTISCSKNGAIS